MNKDEAFFFLSWLALEFSVSQEIRVFSLPHPLCETKGKSRICLISGLNLISEDLRKAEDVNVSCSFSTSEHFQQKQGSITASLIPAFIQRRLLTGRLMANLISDVNVLVYGPASEALRSNVSPSPLIFLPCVTIRTPDFLINKGKKQCDVSIFSTLLVSFNHFVTGQVLRAWIHRCR